MKILTRKLTGLVVLTALLGMPLTHAVANETLTEAQEVISDSWITSKVKSVFLSNTEISGLLIHVETKALLCCRAKSLQGLDVTWRSVKLRM